MAAAPLLLLRSVAALLVGLSGRAGAQAPPAPTGPHPRFMTQGLRADWAKLVAAAGAGQQPYASWYSYLQNHATSDAKVPSPWLTRHTITMYQITGQASWAKLAWQSAQGNFITKYPDYDHSCCNSSYTCCPSSSGNFYGGDNNARIIAGYWVDTYDWIYTYLNTTQRTQFRTKLANMFDYIYRGNGNCCSFNQYNSWPLRSTDSDVVVHNYFSLLKFYAASADEDPSVAKFWTQRYNMGGMSPKPASPAPGGRCANNCYNSSDLGVDMRTAVTVLLSKYTAGGTGMASTGYNLEGEIAKVAYDWAGCRAAFGADYFPELGDYFLSHAVQYMSLTTPDLQWLYRWGDDEAGTSPLAGLYNVLSVMAATTSWYFQDPRQGMIRNFMAQVYGNWSGKHMDPYDEFFFAYMHLPSGPVQDFRKGALAAPGGLYSWDLMGTGQYRTGWSANDSMFGFEYAPYSEVDHFTQHVGNFQLYRRGEWLLNTPVSYGRPTSSGEVTNTMSLYGFPDGPNFYSIREFRGVLDVVFSAKSAFFIGAEAGTFRYPGAWSTPATWQQEHTRSVLYLPGTSLDAILVFDRTSVLDPRTFPKWNVSNWWAGNPKVASKFSTYPRKLWQWHAQTQPVVDAATNSVSWDGASLAGDNWNGYAWKTSTTQKVTLRSHFTRTNFTYQLETTLPGASGFYWSPPASTGYLLKETCAADQAFDATLHVILAGSKTATSATKEYTSTTSISKAVVVNRQGDPDVIAFFNVQVGPTIASNNCGTNYGSPCSYSPDTASIVPTQHYFKAGDAFLFPSIPVTTTWVLLYVHDLNPVNAQYYLFIDGVQRLTISLFTVGGMWKWSYGPIAVGTRSFCVQPALQGLCGNATAAAATTAEGAPARAPDPAVLLP